MTIEPYSDKYFNDVIKIVENFHKEAVGEYDEAFDVGSIVHFIETNREANSNNALLLIIDDVCQGMIFGTSFKSMLNERKIWQEIIWYVNEPYRRHGIKLLKEMEKLLKSNGVSIMIMAVLENSKTEKLKEFYERLGFKKMETHYTRNL
jgi:GNAT superfamily N-acetyltransferase